MRLYLKAGNKNYFIYRNKPLDISIHMDFSGGQPNTYGVPKASSIPYRDDEFVGDVRQGGNCNFETMTLTPHCNGTHTECVGHITEERIYISDILKENLFKAKLITVEQETAEEVVNSYIPEVKEGDSIITKSALEKALFKNPNEFDEALIIRTLPNEESKQSRDYSQIEPPYFTNEAMELITQIGFKHLLVDIPSVDRLFDEGKLSNHHIFWGIPQETHFAGKEPSDKTITEFIYIDDSIEDGNYLLDLRVPAIKSDAAPSRPVIYKAESEYEQ